MRILEKISNFFGIGEEAKYRNLIKNYPEDISMRLGYENYLVSKKKYGKANEVLNKIKEREGLNISKQTLNELEKKIEKGLKL